MYTYTDIYVIVQAYVKRASSIPATRPLEMEGANDIFADVIDRCSPSWSGMTTEEGLTLLRMLVEAIHTYEVLMIMLVTPLAQNYDH